MGTTSSHLDSDSLEGKQPRYGQGTRNHLDKNRSTHRSIEASFRSAKEAEKPEFVAVKPRDRPSLASVIDSSNVENQTSMFSRKKKVSVPSPIAEDAVSTGTKKFAPTLTPIPTDTHERSHSSSEALILRRKKAASASAHSKRHSYLRKTTVSDDMQDNFEKAFEHMALRSSSEGSSRCTIDGDGHCITMKDFQDLCLARPELNLSRVEVERIGKQVADPDGNITKERFLHAIHRRRFLRRIAALYIPGDDRTFTVREDYDYAKTTNDNYRNENTEQFYGRFVSFRKHVDYSYHVNYTKERQLWQDRIISAITVTEPQRCPWIVFTCGPMGAGKSYALSWMSARGIFPLEHIVHIDPDHFKQAMPEWTGYLDHDAATAGTKCHRESGFIQEIAQEVAMSLRLNVWVDGSLRDGEWFCKVFDDLRHRYPNYQVAIFYIYAEREIAWRRCQERAQATGRLVPRELFEDSLKSPESVLQRLTPKVNFIARIANNGGDPTLEAFESVELSGDWRPILRHFATSLQSSYSSTISFMTTPSEGQLARARSLSSSTRPQSMLCVAQQTSFPDMNLDSGFLRLIQDSQYVCGVDPFAVSDWDAMGISSVVYDDDDGNDGSSQPAGSEEDVTVEPVVGIVDWFSRVIAEAATEDQLEFQISSEEDWAMVLLNECSDLSSFHCLLAKCLHELQRRKKHGAPMQADLNEHLVVRFSPMFHLTMSTKTREAALVPPNAYFGRFIHPVHPSLHPLITEHDDDDGLTFSYSRASSREVDALDTADLGASLPSVTSEEIRFETPSEEGANIYEHDAQGLDLLLYGGYIWYDFEENAIAIAECTFDQAAQGVFTYGEGMRFGTCANKRKPSVYSVLQGLQDRWVSCPRIPISTHGREAGKVSTQREMDDDTRPIVADGPRPPPVPLTAPSQ